VGFRSLIRKCFPPGAMQLSAPLSIGAEIQQDNKGMSSAVYSKLQQKLRHYSDVSVWIGGYSITEADLDEQQARIDSIRAWAQSLPPGPTRAEYLHWLTYYYEWGLNDARRELKTHATEKSQEQFRRELREERESRMAILAKGIPTPP
jgi:hypothetical protein